MSYRKAMLAIALAFIVWTSSAWAEDGAVTFSGRPGQNVVVIEPDGTRRELTPEEFRLRNDAAKVGDAQRSERDAEIAARDKAAQSAAKAKADADKKAAELQAKEAAKQAARDARLKTAVEKQEKKIIKNYVDKEYTYGPRSAPLEVPPEPKEEPPATTAAPANTVQK